MASDFNTVAVPICIVVVLVFGAGALYLSHLQSQVVKTDVDFFLTARNSQSASRIAWSFFSASVGAWVLFVPSSFCVDPVSGAGWLGLMTYSFFSGIPILFIAFTGSIVKKRFPTILSIGDYVRMRFGKSVDFYTTLLVLINTGIALSAEYTAIGDLFTYFLGSTRLLPVLLIGSVTLIYTAVGGLFVSIITDRYQAILSLGLLAIVCGYVSATFRPEVLPALPQYLALNDAGTSSIVTLGISLPAAAFFTDSMWQRVWSSENEKALRKGAIYGTLLTILVVFTFGLMGFLATWAGYSTDPSTSFFDILKGDQDTAPLWIVVIVAVIATTLNESAVDTFQNALTTTVTSLAISLGYEMSVSHARLAAVIINIPLIFVGLQGFKITSLYLIMNILTTTATLPIIFGLIPQFEYYVNGPSVLFGCAFSLSSVILYGYISTGSFLLGIYQYFYEVYAWEPFLIALVSSGIGVGLCIILEMGLYALLGVPYVSDKDIQDGFSDAFVFDQKVLKQDQPPIDSSPLLEKPSLSVPKNPI